MNNKKQSESLLSSLLKEISPKQQRRTTAKMQLAAKIQDAIESKGWSQKEFAAVMGQNESIICRWLSGTHNFTTETLLDIQEELDICLLDTKPKKQVGPSYHFTLKAKPATSSRGAFTDFKIFDVNQTPTSKLQN